MPGMCTIISQGHRLPVDRPAAQDFKIYSCCSHDGKRLLCYNASKITNVTAKNLKRSTSTRSIMVTATGGGNGSSKGITNNNGGVRVSIIQTCLLFCVFTVFFLTANIKYYNNTLTAINQSSSQSSTTITRKTTASADVLEVTNSLRSNNNVVLKTELQQQQQPEQEPNSSIIPIKPSETGRRIYVDLGANCGNSYWRVKLGMGPGTLQTLKKPTPTVWETYLWECNPKLIEWYLNDLVAKEPNVTLIPKAATTYNGTATFHLTAGQESMTKNQVPNSKCDPKSPYQPGGASTLFGTAKRAGSSITVETVDFLEWHRALKLQPGDSVHMKIDIEGAELDIIEQFLSNDDTNQICYWYVFWMEYHKEIFQPGTEEYEQHAKFEEEFPKRFKQKCGRDLWPNVFV